MAWYKVQEETIQKCFHLAGVLNSDLTVVVRNEEDPFLAADECEVLGDLRSTTMNTHEACEVEEYIDGEDSLSVCNDLENENWDDSFFAQLNQEELDEEDNDEGEQKALVGTQQNMKST